MLLSYATVQFHLFYAGQLFPNNSPSVWNPWCSADRLGPWTSCFFFSFRRKIKCFFIARVSLQLVIVWLLYYSYFIFIFLKTFKHWYNVKFIIFFWIKKLIKASIDVLWYLWHLIPFDVHSYDCLSFDTIPERFFFTKHY